MNITNAIFYDESTAAAHIEASRWPDGKPVCPHCGSARVRRLAGRTQPGQIQCYSCKAKFTIRTGTVMARSPVPLHQWLLAAHLMAASRKEMSAKRMERILGVNYKTARFICNRIRGSLQQ